MAKNMFNNPSALKFIAWVKPDDYPALVPVLQCQAADSTRLAFSTAAFGSELAKIPPGAEAAVFALTMKMEDVLTRGTFNGFTRHRGVKLGTIDINWVYKAMPPVHGQIYPEKSSKRSRTFSPLNKAPPTPQNPFPVLFDPFESPAAAPANRIPATIFPFEPPPSGPGTDTRYT